MAGLSLGELPGERVTPPCSAQGHPCHLTVLGHKMFLVQPFKSVNPILSSQAIPKQGMGWSQAAGRALTTAVEGTRWGYVQRTEG